MDEQGDQAAAEDTKSEPERELSEAKKQAIEGMSDRELRRFIAELQGHSPRLKRQVNEE